MVLDLRNKGGVFSCFVCFVEPLLLLFFCFLFFHWKYPPTVRKAENYDI